MSLVRSRDHTEIALREFGADIAVDRGVASPAQAVRCWKAANWWWPSDLSSAAFFLVAALLGARGPQLSILGVGVKSHAVGATRFSGGHGGANPWYRIWRARTVSLIGDLEVEIVALARRQPLMVGLTAALIDEIPVLAVLGAATEGRADCTRCRRITH